jgi:hypothetical protein
MEIEKQAIKIIESLNRIMTSWKFLVIRRTLLTIFSLIIFSQLIIITILIIFRRITTPEVEFVGLVLASWGVMFGFYFKDRHYKNEKEKELNKNKRVSEEENEEGEGKL